MTVKKVKKVKKRVKEDVSSESVEERRKRWRKSLRANGVMVEERSNISSVRG